MTKIIDDLFDKIKQINSFDEFEKQKSSILSDIFKIKQSDKLKDFQIKKYLKDKNVINSLLVKTSDDLKKVMEELRVRADELNTLLNTIPAFVFFKDREYKYVIVNKSFVDFINLPQNEIIGKTLKDLSLSHKHFYNYSSYEESVLTEGIPQYNISEKIEKDGRLIWLNTNLAPVKNSKNQIIGLIGVSWDITATKKYEDQLKKAKILAEEGTKAKSRFLANMSHEIRTPLNGIIGMSQILKGTKLTKKQQEFVDIIISSGDNLLVLINDILDFSKIEAGKISFINKDFELAKPFREIKNILSLKAEEKGLLISCHIDDDVPKYVNGDEYRLKQIILNLVNNAVKFTDEGYVKINVNLLKQETEHYTIKVSVKDTGIGIPKEKEKKLFQTFSQLDASSTKQYSGTGLGLAISKRLVEMMEGEIGMVSDQGKGSLFWFTAKFKKGKQPKNESKPDIKEQIPDFKAQNATILVVEDNLINQKITSFSLQKAGLTVTLANNGKEAVELFRKKSFDIILMDIQMPVMDGYDATREIRKIEMTKKNNIHTPIIALTANAMRGDAEKCIAAGMDGYISKPFKPEDLFKALANLLVTR
jgi:PAS domain S-box-containing protein